MSENLCESSAERSRFSSGTLVITRRSGCWLRLAARSYLYLTPAGVWAGSPMTWVPNRQLTERAWYWHPEPTE
jgi:hypothetical protein